MGDGGATCAEFVVMQESTKNGAVVVLVRSLFMFVLLAADATGGCCLSFGRIDAVESVMDGRRRWCVETHVCSQWAASMAPWVGPWSLVGRGSCCDDLEVPDMDDDELDEFGEVEAIDSDNDDDDDNVVEPERTRSNVRLFRI